MVQATDLGERMVRSLSLHRSSDELLYGQQSPFQRPDILALDNTTPSSPLPGSTQAAYLTEELSKDGRQAAQFLDGEFEERILAGDTLVSIWKKLGGDAEAFQSLKKSFEQVGVSTTSLKVGEKIQGIRRDGVVVELRRRLSDSEVLVITGSPSEGYSPLIEQFRIVENERRVSGAISTSLVEAASNNALPYSLVDDFVDLFSNRVEFSKDLQPGDSFTVIFEERVTTEGRQLNPGSIKAASLRLGDKLLAVVRDVAADGTVRYFDESGKMPTKDFLRYPVKFSRISSVFSHARFHPVLHISRPHNGVDYSAPTGTPVRSVGDGVVVHAGYSPSTGHMVRIQHNSRYTTEYMHLSKIAASVVRGSKVERGVVIGAVGQSGLASGPHLHFGMFDQGKYIDPLKAKVLQVPEEVRPPVAVLAMLEELKKGSVAENPLDKSETKTVARNQNTRNGRRV